MKNKLCIDIDEKLKEKLSSIMIKITLIHNESLKFISCNDLEFIKQNLSNRMEIILNLIEITNMYIRIAERLKKDEL